MRPTDVVLPAPLGPSMATISPAWMARSIPRTASTAPYRLVTPAISTTGLVSGLGPMRANPTAAEPAPQRRAEWGIVESRGA